MTHMQKALKFFYQEPSVWGPIFLLFSIALATPYNIPFDLWFSASVGFFLSARLCIRGFCYAIVVLGITSIFKHAFFTQDHLWFLGIEGSLGLAFFITALAADQGKQWIHSLNTEIDTKRASFDHLSEELERAHEESQMQALNYQEKIDTLQKDLDEIQSEHSSILILNEVLRKKTAQEQETSKSAQMKLTEMKGQLEVLQATHEQISKELKELADTDSMASLNKQLMDELNQVRFDKEQALLTNEVLVRQHMKEHFNAKDKEEEAASLKELLTATHEELRKVKEPLEIEIKALRNENETLKVEFEKTAERANHHSLQLVKLSEVQTERNFLKERLEAAQAEIERLGTGDLMRVQQLEKEYRDCLEREHIAKGHVAELAKRVQEFEEKQTHFEKQEELQYAEEKLAKIEPLYLQLKKQFEDKNRVLEETRKNLFKTDTELQKLKMDREALELGPIAKEIDLEMKKISDQLSFLEEENLELQNLVSQLMSQQKKK